MLEWGTHKKSPMAELAKKIDGNPQGELNELRGKIDSMDGEILGKLTRYRDSLRGSVREEDIPGKLSDLIEKVREFIFLACGNHKINFSLCEWLKPSTFVLSENDNSWANSVMESINERAIIAQKIGEVKRRMETDIHDPNREKSLMANIRRNAKEMGLPVLEVRNLFMDIVTMCKNLQKLDKPIPAQQLRLVSDHSVYADTEGHRNIE